MQQLVKVDQQVISSGDEREVVTVYGAETPGEIYSASEGRVPDRHREGVILGADVADRFDLRVGHTLTIDDERHRIVAILERESDFSPASPNQAVLLPAHTFDDGGYSQVVVRAESGDAAAETADAIREDVNEREQRISVFELQEVNEGISSFFSILRNLLVGIGAISLVVAGVSILNVMLITTIERRAEIGTLRAVGVHKRDVLKILLFEAGLLGVVGSLVGITLALLLGVGMNWMVLDDVAATFRLRNLWYLLLAFCFGVGTALVCGAYPAWKAANERPVEALRK